MTMPATLHLLLQSGRVGAVGWRTVMAISRAVGIERPALLSTRIPPPAHRTGVEVKSFPDPTGARI